MQKAAINTKVAIMNHIKPAYLFFIFNSIQFCFINFYIFCSLCLKIILKKKFTKITKTLLKIQQFVFFSQFKTHYFT